MKRKFLSEYEAVFWDFDGVLLNSNSVRDQGFTEVLKEYPADQVAKLMDFHQANGGLSRYVKFRYFFEEIRGEQITEEEVNLWAEKFSIIMKSLLVNEQLLITETLAIVKKYASTVPMHIVSGSDQNELRYLCKEMRIDTYFKSIHGSPKPKTNWVQDLLKANSYSPGSCILIGDSVNDYEAAMDNGLAFFGYNNEHVEALSTNRINLI